MCSEGRESCGTKECLLDKLEYKPVGYSYRPRLIYLNHAIYFHEELYIAQCSFTRNRPSSKNQSVDKGRENLKELITLLHPHLQTLRHSPG